jgi:hypothetical protein
MVTPMSKLISAQKNGQEMRDSSRTITSLNYNKKWHHDDVIEIAQYDAITWV